MKIISHRGNVRNKLVADENKPSYIDGAIKSGYDVEVDIRYVDDNFYLGHDTPDYKVNEKWILDRSSHLLFHCKDIRSTEEIMSRSWNLHYFSHLTDPYVLTSHGYIWVDNISLDLNDKCIIPLLSMENIRSYNTKIIYAVCTDYVKFAEYELGSKGLYK